MKNLLCNILPHNSSKIKIKMKKDIYIETYIATM